MMEEFNYDFSNCFICGSDMTKSMNPLWTLCKNGCCEYEIYQLGEYVRVQLFNESACYFYVGLHEKTKLGKQDEGRLLKEIKYWKEDERYLAKIMQGGE